MSEEGAATGMPHTNPALRVPRFRGRRVVPRVPHTRMPSGFTSVRDILSFVAGIVMISNEVFFQETVEVAILTVGVALAGLPVVFGADEKRNPPADGAAQ